MKKYNLIILSLLLLWSCDDRFLDLKPANSQTEETAFLTYDNFKSYTWALYDVFTNAKLGPSAIDGGHYRTRGDEWAGYLSEKNQTSFNKYGFNTVLVPAKDDGWDFSNVRKVNIMLQGIAGSRLSDPDKAHWEGVGRFFRAYLYYELLSCYGDVPWIDKAAADDADESVIYALRTPRVQVADKMVEDLVFAMTHIKKEGDGPNTINADCAKALMSRFGLFEATWRKYHSVDDAGATYRTVDLLEKAKVASEQLIVAYPILLPNFNERLLQVDLKGKTGVILYKEYITGLIANNITRYERNVANKYELHKAMVDMYLCKDGKTIGRSSLFKGDKSIFLECRNRDPRLLMTIVPPYFDTKSAKDVTYTPPTEFGIDLTEYNSVLADLLPNPNWLRIPLPTWNKSSIIYTSPNIAGIANSGSTSRSGYTYTRHFSGQDQILNNKGELDKPIFYIEEAMLNYAEIMSELGVFSQEVADQAINPLRTRAGIAKMTVADIDEQFDPKRDPTVNPLLWEIRRERIVELMGEGFGFNDIRRWKRAPWFINRAFMGCYIRHADYTDKKTNQPHKSYSALILTSDGSTPKPGQANKEGYLYRFANPQDEGKGWKEAYYLLPIPTGQMALNPKLTQNPGWDKL